MEWGRLSRWSVTNIFIRHHQPEPGKFLFGHLWLSPLYTAANYGSDLQRRWEGAFRWSVTNLEWDVYGLWLLRSSSSDVHDPQRINTADFGVSFGSLWNVLTTVGYITMAFCTHNHAPSGSTVVYWWVSLFLSFLNSFFFLPVFYFVSKYLHDKIHFHQPLLNLTECNKHGQHFTR